MALQAHPEFCSRPLNPSPPFLGLIAAACGADVLKAQLAASKDYVAPHPESAKVVPASEAVTEQAKGKKQEVGGIKVRPERQVNGVAKTVSPSTETEGNSDESDKEGSKAKWTMARRERTLQKVNSKAELEFPAVANLKLSN